MCSTLLLGRKGGTLCFSLTPHLQKTVCVYLSVFVSLSHTYTLRGKPGGCNMSNLIHFILQLWFTGKIAPGGQPSYTVKITSLKTGSMKTFQRRFHIPPSNSCFNAFIGQVTHKKEREHHLITLLIINTLHISSHLICTPIFPDDTRD